MFDVTPGQSVQHYENFPVASILMPARYRKAVASIYHFARHADDLADEGDATPAQRLAALAECRAELARIERNETPLTPRYQALAITVRRYAVPVSLCHDLLTAFEQDVTQTRYEDFGELVQYCRHSAVPVGRILLHIFWRRDLGESGAIGWHLHGLATDQFLARRGCGLAERAGLYPAGGFTKNLV